jgi:hypothetical protein
MAFSPAGLPRDAEARHSDEWYGEALEDRALRHGDRMFIACQGGPCLGRLEVFPPRLEIQEGNGLYVLVDDGPPEAWTYQFVAALDDEA